LRSNTEDYGGKNHWTDSQNSDTTAHNGRELYHLQFSLQAASPETFGYTLVFDMSTECKEADSPKYYKIINKMGKGTKDEICKDFCMIETGTGQR
jgi:hypothetical protein